MMGCLVLGGGVVKAEHPPVEELLETARFVAALQQQDLIGQIRSEKKTLPVGLYLRKEDIQFTYTDPATGKDVRFHLRLAKDHYDLFEIEDGKTKRFPDNKLGEFVAGTDLSYEDLTMRFLYWPDGVIDGEEKVRGFDCWRIRLINKTGAGPYAQVHVWVHKKHRALMKVIGYTREGPALKRFEVEDLMKVGDVFTLKRMRVDRFAGVAGNKVLGNTYLEFDRPKAVAPGGLR